MTDRLTLTRALGEIYDAIRANVATKTDLQELEQRLNARAWTWKRDGWGVAKREIGLVAARSDLLRRA